MAPKNKTPNAPASGNGHIADEAAVSSDVMPAELPAYREAPYKADWINVAAAAKLAEVTTQTVRNAYREHPAFNPAGDGVMPAWYTTKMRDEFHNVTDYDVVYLDRTAVDAWIVARAEKPATGAHGGAKRRIIRLTDAQIAALPVNDAGLQYITLADGTAITVEVPPMGNRKKAADEAPAPDASNGTSAEDVAGTSNDTLFDVALTEAQA